MFIEAGRWVWRTPSGVLCLRLAHSTRGDLAHIAPLTGCDSRMDHVSIDIAPLTGCQH
jgi:hypothetical protein